MKIVKLNFGYFEFYPELIIGKINQGVYFDFEKNKKLLDLVFDYYGTQTPFSYIGLRENDYSVDPMVHIHNSQYEYFCGIAIVNPISKKNAPIETDFFKPGKMIEFENIEDALIWANKEVNLKILETKNNTSID